MSSGTRSQKHHSVDFVFSYGVFVHLEQDVIDAYLAEIHRVLRPDTGRALLQYSDKTKSAAKHSSGFSQNTPDDMRRLVDALAADTAVHR